jgi:arginine:ornithine antiporter / lysine permease
MAGNNKKLGMGLLVALGIGSMIGGGVFNAPTDLIGKANPEAALIAWGIGGFGVLCLAMVFQMLSNKRPELTGGIYSYAQAGFGDYFGFTSAWGYWAAGFLGNVAFFVLFFKTLNSLFGEGKGLPPMTCFILGSVFLWAITWFVTLGVKDAGVLNAIATAAKLIPLLLVMLLGISVFNLAYFVLPNWQTILAASGDHTTLFTQVSKAMGTVLWCFVGVEAAVVLSERAESQKIVGKATVVAFFITLAIYASVTSLAMGIVDAKGLAGAATPLADVLGKTMIGAAGALIVKLGIMISVSGGFLSWVLLTAEVPYVAAKGGVLPKALAKVNKNDVPIVSLLVTNGLTQIFLLSLLSDQLQSAYYMVYYISTTSILIPYLFSGMFGIKVCLEDKSYGKDIFFAVVATLYACYVIYAVGLMYLALTLIIYALGIIPFIMAKREKKQKLSAFEMGISALIAAGSLYLIFQIATGAIKP